MNIILFLGAILGLVSVSMGAYIHHVARLTLDEKNFDLIMTALHYLQLYAIVVTAIGLILYTSISQKLARKLFWIGILFIVGTLLFSGSIYFSITFNHYLNKLAPAGGTTLMLAWALLSLIALSNNRNNK